MHPFPPEPETTWVVSGVLTRKAETGRNLSDGLVRLAQCGLSRAIGARGPCSMIPENLLGQQRDTVIPAHYGMVESRHKAAFSGRAVGEGCRDVVFDRIGTILFLIIDDPTALPHSALITSRRRIKKLPTTGGRRGGSEYTQVHLYEGPENTLCVFVN